MGMKEKVGVVLDRNTTPSSDWLIPLSHSLTCSIIGSTEDAPSDVVEVAEVALSIGGAVVNVAAISARGCWREPKLMVLGRVSLPGTDLAPGDALSLSTVPTRVALLGDHAVSLHPVIFPARFAGAKASTFREFWRLWALSGGAVHPIICRIGGHARWAGHGLWITGGCCNLLL